MSRPEHTKKEKIEIALNMLSGIAIPCALGIIAYMVDESSHKLSCFDQRKVLQEQLINYYSNKNTSQNPNIMYSLMHSSLEFEEICNGKVSILDDPLRIQLLQEAVRVSPDEQIAKKALLALQAINQTPTSVLSAPLGAPEGDSTLGSTSAGQSVASGTDQGKATGDTKAPPLQTDPNVNLPPRVYFHIADDRQREAARKLELLLEAYPAKPGDNSRIVVPGIQRVSGFKVNVLRCFKAEDCRDADRIKAMINDLLKAPVVEVADLSKRFEANTAIRPRHYELWLADEILLKQNGSTERR